MTKSPLCFILMPFGTKANADGSLINFDRVYQGAPFLPLWRPAKALAITLLLPLRIRLRIRFFSPPVAFSTSSWFA